MSTHLNVNVASLHSRKRMVGRIPLLMVSAVLVLLVYTPAFGQMGSSVIYSDSWVDDSTSTVYVIGTGITSDSYNSYNHRYWVSTTLRSPSGRIAGGSSQQSGSYARVDVSLALNFEEGIFRTSTSHSMTCPYIYGVITAPTQVDIKLTRSSYKGLGPAGDGKCLFTLECFPGTSATCALSNPRALPVGTTCIEQINKYYWCLDVSYNNVCVKYVTACVGPFGAPQVCN